MEEDPFFSGHREHMRRMEDMFRDPFSGMGMLEDGRGRDRGRRRGDGNREQSSELAPFGGFGFNFGNMFGNMDRMMQDMTQASQNGNGQMFQQSSVMSYSKSGEGAPKVYQASSATRSGPGGVRETKKTLRDSERELEKMALGHHIYDRGHEMEKHRNTRSGQIDEMQNYHNLDEKDAEGFDREWQDKARTAFRGLEHGERPVGRRGERRELGDRPRGEHRSRGEQLALPDPRSPEGLYEHRGRVADSHRRDRYPHSPEGQSEHWGRTADSHRRDRS